MKRIAKTLIGIFIILMVLLSIFAPKKPRVTRPDPKTEVQKTEVIKWQPKEIAEYNTPYVSKTTKHVDGSNAIINVSSVKVRGNDIVIEVPAPGYTYIKYAVDNYISFQLMDEQGKDLSGTLDKILVSPVNENTTEIIITGIDTNAVRWLELSPFKTKNNNTITFKI